MEVSIKWLDGKYPQFNVILSSKPGSEPFLEVKGCRIVSGSKGEFVSPPSTKQDSGKYWNHCYFSEAFGKVVLEKAKVSQPQKEAQKPAPAAKGSFDDFDVPF